MDLDIFNSLKNTETAEIYLFDLDGVFVPEFDVGVNLADTLCFRPFLKPILQPSMFYGLYGGYSILTGRPDIDYFITTSYIEKYLDIQPKHIFHGRSLVTHKTPVDYKVEVLLDIINTANMFRTKVIFVESSCEEATDIVDRLHNCGDVNVSLYNRNVSLSHNSMPTEVDGHIIFALEDFISCWLEFEPEEEM